MKNPSAMIQRSAIVHAVAPRQQITQPEQYETETNAKGTNNPEDDSLADSG